MALTEIEFELPAEQFEMMGYPQLQQGQALDVQLETALLMPEPGGDGWYAVQKESLAPKLVQVGRGLVAFAGQITEAELSDDDGVQSAALIVDCGGVALRVICGPQDDGTLPYGTWETRYIAGYARIFGVVEEDFLHSVGKRQGVTIWQVRRLALTPGDPNFGEWYEAAELLPSPFTYDRVVITARVHRSTI
jgi:hypothetical protein